MGSLRELETVFFSETQKKRQIASVFRVKRQNPKFRREKIPRT